MEAKAQDRKETPVYSGFIKYFPRAIKAVARLSYVGNQQHNPNKSLHWDRSKSGDELDALGRHLIDDILEKVDDDGILHTTKVAWRAMANLEKMLEENAPTNNVVELTMDLGKCYECKQPFKPSQVVRHKDKERYCEDCYKNI